MENAISSQLESYMDLTAARQKLVASNIANASTPGYRAKDFDFHAEFVRSLDAGNAGAPPGSHTTARRTSSARKAREGSNKIRGQLNRGKIGRASCRERVCT